MASTTGSSKSFRQRGRVSSLYAVTIVRSMATRSSETRTLRAFTVGDLFEKHTSQIVALWNDAHGTRLTVLEKDVSERSSLEYAGQLLSVAIGRPTNMHAPKIVAATSNVLLLFHAKKLNPVWHRVLRPAVINDLRILDGDHDNRRDIAVTTTSGTIWFTFDGKVLRQRAQ